MDGGEDFYNPSGGTAVAEPPAHHMSSGGSAKRPPTKNSYSWTASEYIEHQRGVSWYLLLIVGTAALAGITYLLTREYFTAGIIIVVGVIVGFYARQKPRQIKYELSSAGLQVGDKTYGYHQFKAFSLIKDGSLNSLQLSPLKKLMPPISAYYDAADEETITDIVAEHLPYEDSQLGHIDRLSRRLKF